MTGCETNHVPLNGELILEPYPESDKFYVIWRTAKGDFLRGFMTRERFEKERSEPPF